MAKRTLIEEIDHYFNTVSDEQLEKDLKAANFEFYNKVGENILDPRKLNIDKKTKRGRVKKR